MLGRSARSRTAASPGSPKTPNADNTTTPERRWFEQHISLDGQPYTLDADQASAVLDFHKNTLVTARAGSGKTRVIVAKIAYLVGRKGYQLDEIAAFMFNRAAATEVNARLAAIRIDGQPLADYAKATNPANPSIAGTKAASYTEISVASTFHKYALDLVKLAGGRPEILSEAASATLLRSALLAALREAGEKTNSRKTAEYLALAQSFSARAGQRFCGHEGLPALEHAVEQYAASASPARAKLYRLCLATYRRYLDALEAPAIDFNLLMNRAAKLLCQNNPRASRPVRKLKYILVDEYQDFSYLFFALISAMRGLCPSAHLFAVGDDWQAINRFAGSDVNFFTNFATFFPEDAANIPLLTNYRSARQIVENANNFMLKHYDPAAQRALAFNREKGKIAYLNPSGVRFDLSDLEEDALGDGRYLKALLAALPSRETALPAPKTRDTIASAPRQTSIDYRLLKPAAQLLKSTAKIIAKHPSEPILILHRHNFTTTPGVTLPVFSAALAAFLAREEIMTPETFAKNIRIMTMHRSKGLEAEVVILLECSRALLLSPHSHGGLFPFFGDSPETERADQLRLLYVALTRAKKHLYILSPDRPPIC